MPEEKQYRSTLVLSIAVLLVLAAIPLFIKFFSLDSLMP